ncbi:hypothetical protein TWF694_000237 [Orbilia ellipsospora]|uniref:Uncharacterized protein n=1 Tax=Orbilia ellipsospora TaxID=2528407 RepID=A0AAV9XPE8_9PEZI
MASKQKHTDSITVAVHPKQEVGTENQESDLLKRKHGAGSPSGSLPSSPPDPVQVSIYKPRSYVAGVTIHHRRPTTIKSGQYAKAEMIRVLKISDEVYREFQELIAFLITHHNGLDDLNLKYNESRDDYCDIVNLFLGFLGDDCTNALKAHVNGPELSWILFQLTLKIKSETKLITAKDPKWQADVPYTVAKAISLGRMPHPVAFDMNDLQDIVKLYQETSHDDLSGDISSIDVSPRPVKAEETGKLEFQRAMVLRHSDNIDPDDIGEEFEHAYDGSPDYLLRHDEQCGETNFSGPLDAYCSDGSDREDHRPRISIFRVIIGALIIFWCAIYFFHHNGDGFAELKKEHRIFESEL